MSTLDGPSSSLEVEKAGDLAKSSTDLTKSTLEFMNMQSDTRTSKTSLLQDLTSPEHA